MPWASWLAVWRAHANTPTFARTLARTVDRVRAIDATMQRDARRLFNAVSGGKDSAALSIVLSDAGVTARACHVHTALNTPGTRESAEALAAFVCADLDVFEPDADVFDLLRLPVVRGKDPLLDRASSGSLLVAYTYAGGWDGSWTGMRKGESHGRKMNGIVRGPLYQLVTDGKWIAQPLLDWTERDVWALLVSRGAPLHPHYRLACDRCGVGPEGPGCSRVDSIVAPENVAARGANAVSRRLYPDLWRRVVEARPSLATST